MKTFAAACIILLGAQGFLNAQESRPSTSPASAPAVDPQQVDKLIKQLGDDKWSVRQKAAQDLRNLGPVAVPMLSGYRGDSNPEIADTVNRIIEQWGWATKGNIVLLVDPKGQGKKLGLRCGDVLLRADSTPLRLREGDPVDYSKGRTYTVYRQGSLIDIKAGPGMLGAQVSEWNFAKGGDNQSRGLAAMEQNDSTKAYSYLVAAYREGMDNDATLVRLMFLAECNLQPAVADEVYERFRKVHPSIPAWREIPQVVNLDWTAAHARKLMAVMKDPKAETKWRLETYRFFSIICPSYPILKSFVENPPWPAPEGKYEDLTEEERDELNYRYSAIGSVLLHDRQWDKAIELANKNPCTGSRSIGVQAALEKGDVDEACRLARLLIGDSHYVDGAGWFEPAGSAFLAALATAKYQQADELANAMLQRPGIVGCVLGTGALYNFGPLATHEKLISLLDRAARRGETSYCRTRSLYLKSLLPDMTLDRWRELTDGSGADEEGVYGLGLLRLGQYEEALQQFALANPGSYHANAARLLQRNAKRLETDWQALNGVTMVYDGLEKGSFWALRHDGKAIYVDALGHVGDYPGLLETPQLWQGYLIHSKAGVSLFRQSQCYVLDQEKGQWLATYAATGFDDEWTYAGSAPAIARYLVNAYPVAGSGREVVWSQNLGAKWRAVLVNGDILLVVDRNTFEVIDVTKKITDESKAKQRVPTYRPVIKDKVVLVPTSRGLWLLDEQGKVSPVQLPLDSPEVATVALDWPSKPGKAYVGVIPQQGGQVFEVDLGTRKAALTSGQCVRGQQDSFAASMHLSRRLVCPYPLQKLMNNPDATTSPAATQPQTNSR